MIVVRDSVESVNLAPERHHRSLKTARSGSQRRREGASGDALGIRNLLALFVICLLIPMAPGFADNTLVEDFETGSYAGWTVEGTALGDRPAEGTLPNQMEVSGFRGKGFVNSYRGGDASVGTATSGTFTIERDHIAFLIGGGSDISAVGIELLVDDRSVRRASGSDAEALLWSSWDVREFVGQQARVRIFDRATGGWGHILVDHIIQTETPPDRFDLENRLAEYRSSKSYLNERHRPQFHFSAEINWLNDPNGLVFHNGEYHMFYQYNPAGNTWGHMSWGHAVSEDLVHWNHLPLAIPEEDGIMAFSGSCVVDHNNTSGFGIGDDPPMVAIYTGHGPGKQAQYLAYSNDNGRTWTKYSGNPVIDLNHPDFRDPKVFWHSPTGRWVMVVALAVDKVLVFYGSDDLKNWSELSRFGPAGAKDKPNWECPDLFELPIEGESGRKVWVLEADMGSGSIAGGSGGEYFVGHFDGTTFTPTQDAQWVDFGRDFYAPVSWSDIPHADGRRIWIGWFNNWQTALIPTSPWRGCMSLPRSLSLRRVIEDQEPPGYVLVQQPVHELEQLRSNAVMLDTSAASWPPRAVTHAGQLTDLCFEIQTTLQLGDARSCGFRICTGESEFTEIGYDRQGGAVYVDRSQSGVVDFHHAFAGRHEAPQQLRDGRVDLRIIVDRSCVEVFVNDGQAVISDRIFPTGQRPVIEVFAGDESATITDTVLYELRSIWHR